MKCGLRMFDGLKILSSAKKLIFKLEFIVRYGQNSVKFHRGKNSKANLMLGLQRRKSSICLGLGKDQQGGADVRGSKKWQDTEDIYSAKFVLTLRDSVRDTTLNMRPTIYYKIHTVQDLLLLQMLKS